MDEKMSLYSRCIREITKPELIELYRSYLKLLPPHTKLEILLILCKMGFFKDATILRHLVSPNVVAIDFGECIVNDDMLFCLHGCKYLRSLDLRLQRKQGRHITTNGLLMLFPNIPLLEILDLPHCNEFTDAVTETLCEHCVNLKELYIPFSAVTNKSLSLITKKLNSLSDLNLYGTQVGGREIDFLAESPIYFTVEVGMDDNLSPPFPNKFLKKRHCMIVYL